MYNIPNSTQIITETLLNYYVVELGYSLAYFKDFTIVIN